MERISIDLKSLGEGAIPSMTVKQLANLVQAFTKVKGAVGYRSGYMLRVHNVGNPSLLIISGHGSEAINISTSMVYTLS